MIKLIVACQGDESTRFDRDYYVRKHLPLALECWRPHGLEAVEAFFPAGAGDGWVSLGVYHFRDRAAVDAALAAAETARVMADVHNFTDATVTRSLFTPL